MMPISDHEFWVERRQFVTVFERDGDKVKRAVFIVGDKQFAAPRVE
jgi:hypothetical protein